ncbi:MAG: ElyC/SanA/YdcF family protein [Patescibacteria group bacterium]
MRLSKLRFHLTVGRLLITAAILLPLSAIIIAVLVLVSYHRYGELIATNDEQLEPTNVAIVFGAGLINQNSTPSDMLADRLTTAARLFHAGKVKSILVSGDNRFDHYSEPDVMRRVLVENYGLPEQAIHTDYAGRRTYDTCARAHELWGVRHAILVTQDYHLPRAIMTCEALGIESQGVSGSLREYRFIQRYITREVLAFLKAYIDVYVWPPKYLGGTVEADIDGAAIDRS